jgi:hypothetical protein
MATLTTSEDGAALKSCTRVSSNLRFLSCGFTDNNSYSDSLYLYEEQKQWPVKHNCQTNTISRNQRPSETDSRSPTQEMSRFSRNPMVRWCFYQSPLLEHIISQLNQVMPSHFIFLTSIFILFLHLRLGLPSGLLHSGFLSKTCTFLISFTCAVCPAHLILLYFCYPNNTLWKYKLGSSSLYNFLRPFVLSCLFGLNILFSILFSNLLSLCSSLNVRPRFTPIQTN